MAERLEAHRSLGDAVNGVSQGGASGRWGMGLLAAERTVTLAVDNLWCATCPYIVRTVLKKVPGVQHAEVSFENRIAVVTFDDAKTNVTALTKATADVGFPSEPLTTI